VEPWGYSLRELDWMATKRASDAWDHTSLLAASMGRAMGGKWNPADFHPLKRRSKPVKKVPLTVLRDVFCDGDARKVMVTYGGG
jgi:hypothetical protein